MGVNNKNRQARNNVSSNKPLKQARRNISEDGILHTYRRENLKSYIELTDSALKREGNDLPVSY
jgi:hypothetical protein